MPNFCTINVFAEMEEYVILYLKCVRMILGFLRMCIL